MTREEAIKVLEYTLECVDEETPKGASEAEAIPMAIEALQTDIVRCGECKYWNEGKCWNMKGLNKTDGAVDADDFCSYGERREE